MYDLTQHLQEAIINRGKKAGDVKVYNWLVEKNLKVYSCVERKYVFAFTNTNEGIELPKYVIEGLAKLLRLDTNCIANTSKFYIVKNSEGKEGILSSTKLKMYEYYAKGSPSVEIIRNLDIEEVAELLDKCENLRRIM